MTSAVHGNGTVEDCGAETCEAVVPLKPNLSYAQAAILVKRLYGLEDIICQKEFCSYDNQNLLIEARTPGSALGSEVKKYVLKVTNSEDSQLFTLHEHLNHVLHYVCEKGITASLPVRNLEGRDVSLEMLTFNHKDTGKEVSGSFVTRLMSFIPGDVIGRAASLTGKMCFEAGQLLGRLSCVLMEYEGDKAEFRKRAKTYIWSLSNIPLLRSHTHVIEDADRRKLVEDIVTAFEIKVLKMRDKLSEGLVHSDFNDHNILIRHTQGSRGDNMSSGRKEKDVIGILDFDDLMYSYVVYDIACAIMYVMQCTNLEESILDSGGILLAGFLTERALNDADLEALYYCVVGRFVQSLTLGLYSYSLDPCNDYILATQVKGWQVISDLWAQEVDALYSDWQKLSVKYKKIFS